MTKDNIKEQTKEEKFWGFIQFLSVCLIVICLVGAAYYGFRYFDLMSKTKDCTLTTATIVGWSHAENYSLYQKQYLQAPSKNISVVKDGVYSTYNLQQSNSLEQLREAFPEGDSYIFTFCNDTLRGVSFDDWLNRNFYLRFRQ